ncbi:hypothetical protein [Cohnella terricola]|uniref:ABC transmembrane type-1 domain-containing protein n=1 Tax=Cohnella terricola TaxID=1289167 RepID=A0A559J7G2_9BACL|nr:hypothetical protein [Cohnella terricola]TVX95802.1 hypothetical protein FPZ45_22660 [Cohnella terricola]
MNVFLERIWKYKFHYLLAFLPLLVILLLKFIPFFIGIYMAFVDYKTFYGWFGSEWMGWANFKALFDMREFGNILTNTLAIKLSYLGVVGALSLLLAVALSGIRSDRLRNAFVVLFLIPYFIPSAVFADTAAYLLLPSQSILSGGGFFPLSDPAYFRAVVYLLETLKTCGIPVFLALTAIRAYRSRSLASGFRQTSSFYPAFRVLVAFLLIQLSTILSTDFELLNRLNNPIVYSVGDTVDTFGFRIGFMNANFSMGSALWVFQFAVQLAFTLIVYFLIRTWFVRDLFAEGTVQAPIKLSKTNESAGIESGLSSGKNALGILAASLYSAIVLFFLYFLFVHPFLHGDSGGPGLSDVFSAANFVGFLLLYGITTLIGLMIIIMLAYPLTVSKLPGRGLYKLLLLLALTIGTGGTLHEFMVYREMGMINTVLPLLFNGIIAITGVFVLKGTFNASYASLKLQAEQEGRGEMRAFFLLFIPKVWKPLLGLGVLNFVCLWNSYIHSIIYLSRIQYYPPIAKFAVLGNNVDIHQYPETLLQAGAIVSLPPVLLLLLLSRFLTSEVFLGASRRL